MKMNDKAHFGDGFTLIELMIVIAIIGILSAIAIPNFISYRNKSYCSAAEADAKNIAAAVTDYFSVFLRNNTPHLNDLNGGIGYTLSGNNSSTISGVNPNEGITITVTDASGRCPLRYQAAIDEWDGANVYTLRIER